MRVHEAVHRTQNAVQALYFFPDAGHDLDTKMSAWSETTLVVLEKVLRLLNGRQRMAIALVCKTWLAPASTSAAGSCHVTRLKQSVQQPILQGQQSSR